MCRFALIAFLLTLAGCQHSGKVKMSGGAPIGVQDSCGKPCGEATVVQRGNEIQITLPPQAAAAPVAAAPVVAAPLAAAPFAPVAAAPALAPVAAVPASTTQPACAIPAVGLGCVNLKLPIPKLYAIPTQAAAPVAAPAVSALPAGSIPLGSMPMMSGGAMIAGGQMPMMAGGQVLGAGQMPIMAGGAQMPIMAGGSMYPGMAGVGAYPGMMAGSPYPVMAPNGLAVQQGVVQQVAGQAAPSQNLELIAALAEAVKRGQAQNGQAPAAAAPNVRAQEQMRRIQDFEERIDRLTKQLESGAGAAAAPTGGQE